MHNTIAHHWLTEAKPHSLNWLSSPFIQLTQLYILGMVFYGVKYPFVQFRSPVPAMQPSSLFLSTSSLAEHETHKK